MYRLTQANFYADLPGAFALVPHQPAGPRVGDLLAGAGTKILSEGRVLLLGGVLCIAVAWLAAQLQPGLRK